MKKSEEIAVETEFQVVELEDQDLAGIGGMIEPGENINCGCDGYPFPAGGVGPEFSNYNCGCSGRPIDV